MKGDEDVFFEYASELSQKNFEDNGEPHLTLNQFEELRKKVKGHNDEAIGLFISLGEYGLISLN